MIRIEQNKTIKQTHQNLRLQVCKNVCAYACHKLYFLSSSCKLKTPKLLCLLLNSAHYAMPK